MTHWIHRFYILFSIVALSPVCHASPDSSPRIVLNMNTDWAFYRGDTVGGEQLQFDDSHWIPAVVPHVMQLEKKHCGGNTIYDGVGWYRRYFKLPQEHSGKRIVVSFEGVMKNSRLFVNGHLLNEHFGGYIGFVVDITDYINWSDDNVLAVRVCAADDPLTPPGKPQGQMDFYYYSGIYRDVSLIITDKVFVTNALEEDMVGGGGQFIHYPAVDREKATVAVSTHLRNKHLQQRSLRLVVDLLNAQGRKVSSAEQSLILNTQGDTTIHQTLQVRKPSLWHPFTPYLYSLRTRIYSNSILVDEVSESIGIRTIKYTKDGGFFINGQHLYMRGANRHQAYAYVGDAASNSMQERDVIQLKQGGYNAVRAAHYPQDPAFLAACDKYGLLVIECIPGWQFFNRDSSFIRRTHQVGRQMIRRDRNHPSIVLWETALNESRYPVSLARELYELAHAEYPGGQLYTAGDYFGHQEMEPYYDVLYKQVNKFPRDGNVMTNYIEDFISIKPLLTREWGDGVGEKPRVSVSENEEEQMRQCRSRFTQLNGQGYFDWCMLDANPAMGGHYLWSYNDYARGSQEETMFCGVVDINRHQKFSYYMMQSMRNPAVAQKGLYDGPMVYIASYNAGPAFTSSTTEITVFSNATEVRLYRNDKLIGVQTRGERTALYQPIVDKGGSPCYIFNATNYVAGELRAEAFIGRKRVATHTVRTPEAPHRIEIEIADRGIAPIADGSDMIPVFFRICDRNGTLVSDSKLKIKLEVTGEGELMGDGIARVEINPQTVEGGVGFAFIRVSKNAGAIQVSASAEGLLPGKAVVTTLPFGGRYVPAGKERSFNGHGEDNVVVKASPWQKNVLLKPRIAIDKVQVTGSHDLYPASNIIDNNDHSWWIADGEELPQVITLVLDRPRYVTASRVMFQKDSSSYKHKVETSRDGVSWELLYDRECTGWEFKPQRIDRELKYLRLSIYGVSEGRAGLAEISLY